MAGTAWGLFEYSRLAGAYIGAIALSAGVVVEMIASHFMCLGIVKMVRQQPFDKTSINNLSYKKILTFYFPLALATFIGLGAHPLITFLVGHSRMALESLAVLPVINSLIFIFRSVGLSYQEVGIALMGDDKKGYKPLKRFAIKLALINVSILSLIAFTPLVDTWFVTVSGLSDLLASIAVLPTQILVLIPAMTVLISFQRAIQIAYKKTAPISKATAFEVAVIVIVLFSLVYFFDMIGVTAAAISLVLGRLTSNSYLYFINKKCTTQTY
jgi:O-antigen/teichoic acid export membrane protein